MTEFLLQGLLAKWAKENFRGAKFQAVTIEASINADRLGMTIWQKGKSESEAWLAFDLSKDEVEKIQRIEVAYGLERVRLDFKIKDQQGWAYGLSANAQAGHQDMDADAILKAVLHAQSDGLARAAVMGARYRLSAYDLAKNHQTKRDFSHQGEGRDIKIENREIISSGFYQFERISYAHSRFDGEFSPILHREMLVSGDAVIVLPYDPKRKEFVLIEQMRPAALSRRSVDAWSLEAVAGVIGEGEAPEFTAIRELEEEAGLKARALYPISPSYQSPGTTSQFMYPFVAGVDLKDYEAGIFGLPEEGEDIRSHVFALKDASRLLETGEANNAPLQILLYALLWRHEEISNALLAHLD